MKKSLLLFSLLAASYAIYAEEILFEESFNTPTDMSSNFPPNSGEEYKKFHRNITAWANNEGQISVTYADGIGADNTGGLSGKIVKQVNGGGYAGFAVENVKIPVDSPEQIEACLKRLVISYSARVPAGKIMKFVLMPGLSLVTPDNKPNAYPSAITLSVTGTDNFDQQTHKLLEVEDAKITRLAEFLRASSAATGLPVTVDVCWHMQGNTWLEGESIILDNIKVSTATP